VANRGPQICVLRCLIGAAISAFFNGFVFIIFKNLSFLPVSKRTISQFYFLSPDNV
jgi:hypothetical protein